MSDKQLYVILLETDSVNHAFVGTSPRAAELGLMEYIAQHWNVDLPMPTDREKAKQMYFVENPSQWVHRGAVQGGIRDADTERDFYNQVPMKSVIELRDALTRMINEAARDE